MQLHQGRLLGLALLLATAAAARGEAASYEDASVLTLDPGACQQRPCGTMGMAAAELFAVLQDGEVVAEPAWRRAGQEEPVPGPAPERHGHAESAARHFAANAALALVEGASVSGSGTTGGGSVLFVIIAILCVPMLIGFAYLLLMGGRKASARTAEFPPPRGTMTPAERYSRQPSRATTPPREPHQTLPPRASTVSTAARSAPP
eukprot:CAMPEP_0195066170 /NCGR_PEP_ID=MMETSP0448-20130528/11588_1 /TAXON_ID=66468 /ORGANISM="Heterocapsa triquestra, Strain CCMP 448" /LENGTH=204 /DNA_ID=CAMNT_0040097365 /DNA_START=109 /DNA_END=720 /DNA_ORIENTATION=+